MKPGVNDANVEIPVTFDVQGEVHELPQRKITIGVLMLIGVLLLGITVFLLNISILNAIISVVLIIVGVTLIRYVWFSEGYYTKCYRKLVDSDFKYSQDLIWDIYDISDGYPAICRYRNGVNAVFVAFDKDIIIGKGLQNEYSHYEAISDAYQFIAQKGISFMHIDYMDVVGKDERFEPVIQNMLKTPNEDLRQLLAASFEYQQFKMNRSYAAYDVYAFFYKGDDNLFLSELDNIIAHFMEANFIRYKILDVSGIRELVKSVYNIPEFSVYKACDKVLAKASVKKYVRVRKVFKNGEMTVISKTSNEVAYEKYQHERERANNRSGRQQQQNTNNEINNVVSAVDVTSGFNNTEYGGQNNQGYVQNNQEFVPNGYGQGNQGFVPNDQGSQGNQGFNPMGRVPVQNPFATNNQQFTPVQNDNQFTPVHNNAQNGAFNPVNNGHVVQNPFVTNNNNNDDETIDW